MIVLIANRRFRFIALSVGTTILAACIWFYALYWFSVVAGLFFGSVGLLLDYFLRNRLRTSASGWALTLGGGVLIFSNQFHPYLETASHLGWLVLVEYVAVVWIVWGGLMYIMTFEQE